MHGHNFKDRTVRFTMMLTPAERTALQEAANDKGVRISTYAREALMEAFRRDEAEPITAANVNRATSANMAARFEPASK